MDIKETIGKLGIEDEAVANALSELLQSQEDKIVTLTSSRDGLLGDKSKWKKENEEALSEAETIRNEALRKAGDYETLEAELITKHQNETKTLKEQLAAKDGLILGKATEATINSLANEFVDPNVGKMMLKNMVTTNYSESGEPITSLNGLDGQSLTNEPGKFAETLKGIEGFSSVLKGPDSSGGGGQGGSGSGAPAGNDVKSRLSQRLANKGVI